MPDTVAPSVPSGYVFRSSRRYPRLLAVVCFTLDTHAQRASYVGTARVDGYTVHAWRVSPVRGSAVRSAVACRVGTLEDALRPFTFRPFYVFGLKRFEDM